MSKLQTIPLGLYIVRTYVVDPTEFIEKRKPVIIWWLLLQLEQDVVDSIEKTIDLMRSLEATYAAFDCVCESAELATVESTNANSLLAKAHWFVALKLLDCPSSPAYRIAYF